VHNSLEKELHERRRQRLEKIRKDFPLWFNTPLPERASTSLNRGKCGWRLATFRCKIALPEELIHEQGAIPRL
jgi:hypothetical protein